MLLVPNSIPFTVGSVSAPGHRDIDIAPAHPGAEAAERHFNGGAVVGIGDQPVGELVRAAVRGPGPADAEVVQPRPAEVLDDGERSGAQDFEARHGYLLGQAARN